MVLGNLWRCVTTLYMTISEALQRQSASPSFIAGPRSRIRQLYVNGKLARCMDEYHIFKRCLLGKLNPQVSSATDINTSFPGSIVPA